MRLDSAPHLRSRMRCRRRISSRGASSAPGSPALMGNGSDPVTVFSTVTSSTTSSTSPAPLQKLQSDALSQLCLRLWAMAGYVMEGKGRVRVSIRVMRVTAKMQRGISALRALPRSIERCTMGRRVAVLSASQGQEP